MPKPLYFLEVNLGRTGRVFLETDRDKNSFAEVVALVRSGEAGLIKALEVVEDEGTCRDVTDDILTEAFAGIDPEPEDIDHAANAADRARDLRKHEVA